MKILKHTALPCLWVLLALFLVPGCQPDQTFDPIRDKDHFRIQGFRALRPKHQLKLAGNDEPGQRLIICGKLVHHANSTPMKYTNLHLYQADDSGEFHPASPGDESTARLSGYLQTNDLGMFFLETILPGGSDKAAQNQYLRLTIPDAQPEVYDIYFQQLTGYWQQRSINKNDQEALVDLKLGKDGSLVGFPIVAVKGADAINN